MPPVDSLGEKKNLTSFIQYQNNFANHSLVFQRVVFSFPRKVHIIRYATSRF